MKTAIIYYTDNRLEEPIDSLVKKHLKDSGLPIVSASLKPIDFGNNAVIDGERGYTTMVKQIISCLERSDADAVFFCEQDVIYPKSHFNFEPLINDVFYYNENVWRWEFGSDRAIKYYRMLPLSTMCANREFALAHFKLRLETILKNGWDKEDKGEPKWLRKMGYEPGTKKKKRGGITDDDFDIWTSKIPVIDIRHKGTFSSPKIELESFKHKPKWWTSAAIETVKWWDEEKPVLEQSTNQYVRDLSILIPARNEMFLKRTIDDILENIEADTEIIAVLDGAWSEPLPEINDRVNIIYLSEPVGQREATNIACRLSRAKYVMKLDAHCSVDKGFDRKMIEAFGKTGDDVTMLPVMRNLWAFDWKCNKCGWKCYQANRAENEKCPNCGADAANIERKIIWEGKNNPQSTSYCFNSVPQFKYFEDWKHRKQYKKNKVETGLTETMSIQGSCFMLTREKYNELNICDESLGSWGNQGIEVACKTWLSGGRVITNHATWYAHLFRTNHNLKFPWPVSGRSQEKTKHRVWKQILEGKLVNQKYSPSWLVEKFWPVYGWTDEDLKKLKQNESRF